MAVVKATIAVVVLYVLAFFGHAYLTCRGRTDQHRFATLLPGVVGVCNCDKR